MYGHALDLTRLCSCGAPATIHPTIGPLVCAACYLNGHR